jgi:DNA-binding LacI/PurR family transcriptional regulator
LAKYFAIFETLQRDILGGKYSHGRRLPSEAELSRRHQVSRPTAARALRELEQMGVITRRAGVGNFLRQERSTNRGRVGMTFGLLVPGLGNTEILDPISNEITRYAQGTHAEVLWGDANTPVGTAKAAEELCRSFIDRGVDGVFFAPVERIEDRESSNREIVRRFHAAGIPLVLLDRDSPEFPDRSAFDLVGIDNVGAGIELTSHLLEVGSRRICFLSRPHFPSTTDLRRIGCEEALRRKAVRANYPFAHYGDPEELAFVRGILKRARPDAIVCANDQVAARLMQTLSLIGLRVPEDLRICGFDDVRYATLLTVPLTTMRQPCRDLGRTAVRTLLERVENKDLPARQILLKAELVPRASTGN